MGAGPCMHGSWFLGPCMDHGGLDPGMDDGCICILDLAHVSRVPFSGPQPGLDF